MKTKNQFSNNKIYFHSDRLLKVLSGSVTAPIVYELSLSGFCNCQCKYCCCQNYHNGRMLSISDIDILAEQLKGSAAAVTITGGGEPLTNPNFCYCVKKMKSIGLSVGVITNGLLLDNQIIDIVIQNASFIRISLDTTNIEKYKLLRGINLDLETLENNLKLLCDKKRELHSKILIGTHIVFIDQPIDDIENTIKFSKKCNIDFMQIRPQDNIPKSTLLRDYQFYIKNKIHLEKLSEMYSDNAFKVILNTDKFEEYYNKNVRKEYKKCLGANFTAAIGHDMNLYFCCSHIGNSMFCIGNLREHALENLLYSEKRRQLIENPCFENCQIQCRNHKLNKLLHELKKMDFNQQNILITEKRKGSLPQHYEFL